jgi:hypothetical protein
MPYMLFIGGSHDGEWHNIRSSEKYITLHNTAKLPVFPPDAYIIPNVMIHHERFKLEGIRLPNEQEVLFFIHEDLTPTAAIHMLINNYRRRS